MVIGESEASVTFTKKDSMMAWRPLDTYISARASKHILLIAPSAYPLGGVATWLDYLVPGLRDRDWNVTLGLVEGRFHDVDAYLDIHPDNQVLRIPYGTGTPEGRVRQLVHALHQTLPDIVVTVNIADVAPAVDRIRVRSEWSPRVAVALHAVQADFISSIGNCAGVLDAVVGTNRLACAMVARSTSVEPNRIYYAPYGVETNEMTPSQQRDPNGILRIAYVGRLERTQKRINDIRAVVAELDRRGLAYELVIAGRGPDEEWLRLQLSGATGSGRVRFLGSLAGNDVGEQVYSQVEVLLITSLWETGPIVAWEAMAHGVVVVTSAYIGSGLEGTLKPEDNCLMFPIGDATKAVDGLERLRDPGLRRRLVQGGLALVAARYSKTASIGDWDSCFRQIAARPPLIASHLQATRAPPAGRLDRLFGPHVGETIRELFKLGYEHRTPGGEWPHANVYSAVDEEAFWRLAISLDRSGAETKPFTSCGEAARDAIQPNNVSCECAEQAQPNCSDGEGTCS